MYNLSTQSCYHFIIQLSDTVLYTIVKYTNRLLQINSVSNLGIIFFVGPPVDRNAYIFLFIDFYCFPNIFLHMGMEFDHIAIQLSRFYMHDCYLHIDLFKLLLYFALCLKALSVSINIIHKGACMFTSSFYSHLLREYLVLVLLVD